MEWHQLVSFPPFNSLSTLEAMLRHHQSAYRVSTEHIMHVWSLSFVTIIYVITRLLTLHTYWVGHAWAQLQNMPNYEYYRGLAWVSKQPHHGLRQTGKDIHNFASLRQLNSNSMKNRLATDWDYHIFMWSIEEHEKRVTSRVIMLISSSKPYMCIN